MERYFQISSVKSNKGEKVEKSICNERGKEIISCSQGYKSVELIFKNLEII